MNILLKDLRKQFKNKTAVNGIDLSIDGGFVCITGRSGSGKSTLLKMIGLLSQPTSGEVIVNGKNIFTLSEREKNLYRNKTQGFVFQDYSLDPNYTVEENVELPLLIAKLPRCERKKRVAECLSFVGLSGMEKQKAHTLSGGEQQRTAIARAIANYPSVILADEPCGNLDKENGNAIIQLFRSLADNGVTVIMVTHNEEDALKTDRIIRLSDGIVIEDEKI